MTVYYNIYNILAGKLIPDDITDEMYHITSRINNCNNNITIIDLLKKKNHLLEDTCYYNFWKNNKNFDDKFDLHEIQGQFINDILDAIYDYCCNKKILKYYLITGNGAVIKPKVLKYLKEYKMKYEQINNGLICIKL